MNDDYFDTCAVPATIRLCNLRFVGFSFFSTGPRGWLGRNDLFSVEWDVKPYSVQYVACMLIDRDSEEGNEFGPVRLSVCFLSN